jgi:hypothetical protein
MENLPYTGSGNIYPLRLSILEQFLRSFYSF